MCKMFESFKWNLTITRAGGSACFWSWNCVLGHFAIWVLNSIEKIWILFFFCSKLRHWQSIIRYISMEMAIFFCLLGKNKIHLNSLRKLWSKKRDHKREKGDHKRKRKEFWAINNCRSHIILPNKIKSRWNVLMPTRFYAIYLKICVCMCVIYWLIFIHRALGRRSSSCSLFL